MLHKNLVKVSVKDSYFCTFIVGGRQNGAVEGGIALPYLPKSAYVLEQQLAS